MCSFTFLLIDDEDKYTKYPYIHEGKRKGDREEKEEEIKEQQAKVRRSNQSRLLKAIEIPNDLLSYGFHLLAAV